MEQYTELIPMDADLQFNLEARYKVPFRNNIAILTVLTLSVYVIIIGGSNGAAVEGYLRLTETFKVKVIYFDIVLALSFLWSYIKMYRGYARRNIHYLKDAEFGFILKERMMITKVFRTPAGINIYWLSSDEIKSFVPDPYRHFREGEVVTIYYLKHSKEYLAYEL